MSIRRPDRRERLGRGLIGAFGRRAAALLLVLATASALAAGCARYSSGFYHRVESGENLYRIGLRYGVEARTIAEANGIRDVTELQLGQRLWIPKRQGDAGDARRSAGGASREAAAAARQAARTQAQQGGELSFLWPVNGARLTSRFGRRRGRPHEGVDLAAHNGTQIRAAESGRVIHSGRLGDYGNVVIVKHAGDYRTVYAHARKLYVRKGEFVERGQRIAEVGNSGNASGPHLHFEIRQRETPRDPLLYLR